MPERLTDTLYQLHVKLEILLELISHSAIHIIFTLCYVIKNT